jgi:hypothetical protein
MLRLTRASQIPVVDFTSHADPCHGLSHGHFLGLSETLREQIFRLIARVSEKSYRRGFQQGYDSHKRGDHLCDLLKWRFEIDLDYSVSPHCTYHSGSAERMELECHVGKLGLGGTVTLDSKAWDNIFSNLFRIMRKRKRTVSAKRRFEVLRRDGFKCTYCGARASASELHVDHVIPVVDGGSDELNNLVSACIDCNLGKGKTRI